MGFDLGSNAADLIGVELDGRYRLVRKLGEGGMGAVYLARQIAADRDVAVKVVSQQHASDPGAVKRFLQEARACCSLHHPNVVTVHDFGRTRDGMLYLVMELLGGLPLTASIHGGPMDPARVKSIGAQVCLGLHEAHRNGIVHRDLKPDNIMLCPMEGIGELVKVLDFGIAKSLAGSGTNRSTAGLVLGTPAYMSPEQGTGDLVDSRSDIYSLGVVLYEMLAGRPPFLDESSVGLLVKHAQEPPPPLSRFRVLPVPAALETLVMRCLAKKPAERPPNVAEVRRLLLGDDSARDESGLHVSLRQTVAERPVAPDSAPSRSAAALAAAPRVSEGTVLVQRYRVERVLRSGGGADLVEATDLASRQSDRVLVRLVGLGATNERAEVDLLGERWLSMLTHVRHERMVSLLETVHDRTALLLVSEIPMGEPLSRRLRRSGPVDPAWALGVALQVCELLESLHDLGLAHHDLRPGTLIVEDQSRVRVADAGVWTLYEAGIPVLTDEEAQVALLYKAPEQSGAVRGGIGPESDLYAIGVVLYEMLTGRVPFGGQTRMQMIQAKVATVPQPPSHFAPQVGPALDSVVMRLLNPLPEERYRSARGLAFDLKRIAAGEVRDFTSGGADRSAALDAEGRLHGREWERSFLMVRLAEARRGQGATVILRGPPGMGKTRLLEDFAFDARRKGAVVLWAKSREHDAVTPLAGCSWLLSQLPAELDVLSVEDRQQVIDRVTSVAGDLGGLLRPLSPFADHLFANCPPPPPLEEDAARSRLMQVISTVLLSVASPDLPLCLVMEDVQWLDGATLMAIEHLANGVSRAPAMLICSMRPLEPEHPVSRVVQAIEKVGATMMDLSGLSAQAVYAFVAERVGEVQGLPEFSRRLQELTEGNPAALRDSLIEADKAGVLVRTDEEWSVALERLHLLAPSESIVERVLSRLVQLPHGAKRCLAIAAAWGRPFDVGTLQSLLPSESRDGIISAVVESERAGVLRAVTGRVGLRDFAHDRVREGAMSLAAPEDLRAVHLAAARLLAAEATAEPGRGIEQRVAQHYLMANAGGEGFEWYRKAALASLQAWSGEGAIRFGEAALAAGPCDPHCWGELHRAVARGHVFLNNLDSAMAKLHQVLASQQPVESRVETLSELAHVQHLNGDLRQAVESLDQGLALLGWTPPRSAFGLAARLIARLVQEVAIRPRAGAGFQRSDRIDDRARSLALLLVRRSEIMFFIDAKAGFVSLLEGLRHARRSRDVRTHGRLLSQAVLALGSGAGMVQAAWRLKEAAIACGRAEGDLYSSTLPEVFGMGLALDMDRYDEVERLQASETRSSVYRIREPWLTSLFEVFIGEADLLQGKMVGLAEQSLKLASMTGSGRSRHQILNFARSMASWAALYSNRPELVKVAADQGLDATASDMDVLMRCLFMAARTQAHALMNETDQMVASASEMLKMFEHKRPPRRYAGKAYAVTAEALVISALRTRGNPEILALLKRVIREGTRVVKPYANQSLRMRLARAQYHTILGHRLRGRLQMGRLRRDAEKLSGRSLAWTGAVFYHLGMQRGGETTAEGLRLLERAARETARCDDIYWLRQALARALPGQPLRGGRDPVGPIIASTLGIPESEVWSREAPSGTTTEHRVRRGLMTDLTSQVAQSLSALARAQVGIEGILGPVTQYAGAEAGAIVRQVWGSDRMEWVARFPANAETDDLQARAAIELCQRCLERNAPVVHSGALSPDGAEGGASAALPLGSDEGSSLVLYLENRYIAGVFGPDKIATLSGLSSILVAATVIAGRSPNRAAPAQAARETILRRSECALLQAEFPQAERISRDVDPEDFIRLHADLVQKLQAIPVTTDDSVISLCCAGSTLLFSGRERPEQNCEAAMEAAGRVLAGYQTVFRAFIDPGQPICRFGLASGHASHGVVQAGDRNWGIAVGRPVAEAAELVSRSNDGQVALGRHSRMLLGRCPGLNQSPIEEVASGLWRIGLRDTGDGCLRS